PRDGGTPVGEGTSALGAIAWAVGKVVLLGVLVFTVGSRVVPWLLVRVARAESRELFTLAVLAVALGIAYLSAAVFDVSMALGAFLAGMVVAQSDVSHRAAAEALPLRDAFAVLFFVSVGMLFDPAFLLAEPWLVLATLAIVLVAKPATALVLVLALRYPVRTGLTAAAGLAQIGEFSFILAGQGVALGLFPGDGRSVVIACAVISIAANPFILRSADRVEVMLRAIPFLRRWLAGAARAGAGAAANGPGPVRGGHAILCGHGRVGSVLAEVLRKRGWPFVVVEQRRRAVEALCRQGVDAINGDAASPEILDMAGLGQARLLLVALTDPVATSLVVARAASVNPALRVLARVDSESERAELHAHGPVEAVVGSLEAAFQMARHLLQGFGVGTLESEAAVLDLRSEYGYGPSPRSARFVEVEVRAGSAAAGTLVSELPLPPGTLLVVVKRRGERLIPRGGTRLEAGDALLALADEDGRAHLDRMSKPAPADAGPLGSAAS
ncbi:MAG TPA: cation:proton antiporter, partial [Planctomycetota bacterium]|nr:cation:proton antiporter [Planctomycetota bacterium]